MKKSFYIALITCSSLLLIPTACSQSQTTNHNQSALAAGEISTESIQQTAFAITVKITVRSGYGNDASEKSGSGVLIAKSGNIYTVVTNAHVIGDEKYSFQIKTFDGKTHTASLKNIKTNQSGQKDLALLQFQATEKYTPASLGDPKQVTPNQPVFTSGFADDEAELTFNSGKVGQISQKPLMGGYQIGFTNSTKQGMSGGALLNNEGKIIGILGMGAAAILDNAYTYADGSRPDAQMLEKLRANSFAVPVASLIARNDLSTALAITKPAQSSKYEGLVGQVDSMAQQITVKIDSKNNGNGSGVIVAHEGDTYYVVTAGHVVTNKDDYTIVAPDGKSYPIENSTIKTSEGTDLAVVQFTSQESYSTATIADYINNPDYRKSSRFDRWIFVSGFPGNQRERKLTGGQFAETGNWTAEMAKDSFSLTNGNGLLYKNTSLPGMSGGAVLDSQGRLIGINTGAENEYVEGKTGQYEEVALGYSLGVPSKNFLNLVKLADLPATALKQENSLPLELTKLEINSIKEQLFAFKTPGKNATEADWLNYGNQLWRVGEDKKAVVAFDRAIALNPQDYRAYYSKGLASSWFEEEQKKEKIDALKQATKLNPDFYAAWQALAFNLSFAIESEITKNLLESLAAYNRAIQLEPKIFSNYIRRGDVLERLKRYDEAIASYDRSIKVKPDSKAYEGKAKVYIELENYQAAISSYDQWIKLQPDAHAYQGKADVYLEKLENYQAAIDNYNQAKKLDPLLDNSTTNHGIGSAYIGLKDYQSAIAILSQAIENEKSDFLSDSVRGALYLNRGNAYAELKNYQSALSDYNQAISLRPSTPEPYLARALFYYDLKDVPKGDRDLDKGVELLEQSIYDGYSDESQLEDIANVFKDNGKPEAERKIQGEIAYSKAIPLTNQAVKLAELNKHQEAIKLHNQAIAIDPQHRFHYTARAATYYELKEYQLALKDLDKAIEVNPKYAPAYDYRSVIYRELKDYQKALSDSNKAISVNPELASAYLGRGGIYYRLNQPQKAKNNWQKAAELYADSSSSGGFGQDGGQEATLEEMINELQQNAQKARRKNDLESYSANKAALKQFQIVYYMEQAEESRLMDEDKQKAIEFFSKVIAIAPKYTEAYLSRASAYIEFKNYSKAIADYKKAIEIEPKSASTYRARGQAYKDLNNYPKAIADYKKAIEIESKEVWSYLELAKFYMNLKDYQSAILTYNKAIALDPDSDIYNFRASVYVAMKEYRKAIADYTKTIENDPGQEDSYLNRGQAYSYLKNYKLAIADFTKAIKDYPEYTDAYWKRSQTYFSLKNYQAAIKDLTKAIEICNKDEYGNICTEYQPTIAQLHLDRSVNYFVLKQYSKALVDLNKVILLEPKNPDAYLWRGKTYQESKQYSKALADSNKVILLEPKNADAYLQRGSAYYSLKDDQQAKENWQTAAKLYKQQGKWQFMFTKLQNQAQAEKQKGDVELYEKVQQVIEIFEQFE